MRGPQVPTQPARVTPEGVERVPRGLEQEGIEDTGIPLRQGIEGVGQGKHTVEIRDGQEVGQARLDPPRLGERLALGAVAIAARMVPGLIRPAVVALQQVPAQGGGPALLDRAHHPELLPSRGYAWRDTRPHRHGKCRRLPAPARGAGPWSPRWHIAPGLRQRGSSRRSSGDVVSSKCCCATWK